MKEGSKNKKNRGEINLGELEKIIKLIEDKNITEFALEEEGRKIHIKRGLPLSQTPSPQISQMPPPPSSPSPPPQPKEKTEELLPITSPMVGTFYRAPTPESEPFVEVGSRVEVGSVVCIIEAMKLMNEIKSEYKGEIVKILVENGQSVEYGQELFLIKPER
jgi:oxaloacetate decarboxylase alpha subunit